MSCIFIKKYSGFYHYKEKRIPTLVVVKCGSLAEEHSKKPGNRGKRDSQIILMNFLSKLCYDERMTPLDYEIYLNLQKVFRGNLYQFDLVLMVDADTVIDKLSIGYMVEAMMKDYLIMGVCGETRVSNKSKSWVTAIQVFEYFLSHYFGKSFE